MGLCCCKEPRASPLESPIIFPSNAPNICTLTRDSIDRANKFSFEGEVFYATCVDIYDGDTITIAFIMNGKVVKYSVRVMGYDSEEIKQSPTDPLYEVKKAKGRAHRDALKALIDTAPKASSGYPIVVIHAKKFDKYGRILADIMVGNTNVTDYMLHTVGCLPYDGKTKQVYKY